MKVKLEFSLRAAFIGMYITPDLQKIWICPLPFVCIYVKTNNIKRG